MARSTIQREKLSPDEMLAAVTRFERLVARIEKFDPDSIDSENDPKIAEISNAISAAVEKTYSVDTFQYHRLIDAAYMYSSSMIMGGETPVHEFREDLRRGKEDALVLMNGAIGDLKEDLEEQQVASPPASAAEQPDDRSVFVVHGHDGGAKEMVARFLSKMDLNPIILHEQASEGQTIIEKFERHSNVGFAVVLLTPDDVGGVEKDHLQPRARQNVILELGYFIGKLGRDRVCALKRKDVEIPSDFDGIVYVSLDDAGAWHMELAKEIEAAGIKIDWNKVMVQ